MFQNFDSARNYVDAHHIQMIDLKFTDLWGRLHHLTLPASQFTPDLMKAGIGFSKCFGISRCDVFSYIF